MPETLGFKVSFDGQEAEDGLSRVRARALSTAAAFGGLAVAAGAFAAKAVEAANAQYAAETKLEVAIKASGQAATFNADAIKKLAAERQRVTKFGDELTIQAGAMLATFGLEQRSVEALLPLVQDLAAMMDVDLNQAAIRVGKSMTRSAAELAELGITFDKTQEAAFNAAEGFERTQILADILAQNVGGAAVALHEATGAMDSLQNYTGDAVENIGKLLKLPFDNVVGGWAKIIRDVNSALEESDFWQTMFGEAGFTPKGQTDEAISGVKRQLQSELAKANRDLIDLTEGGGGAGMSADAFNNRVEELTTRIYHLTNQIEDFDAVVDKAGKTVDKAADGPVAPGKSPEKDKAAIAARDRFNQRKIESDMRFARFMDRINKKKDQDDLDAAEKAERDKLRKKEQYARAWARIREQQLRDEERQHEESVRRRQELYQQLTDAAIGAAYSATAITTNLMTDLINGEEMAFERAALAAVAMVGAELTAKGAAGITKGMMMNAEAPGSGIPLMAIGAAAMGQGLAMSAGSAVAGAALAKAQAGGGYTGVAARLGIVPGDESPNSSSTRRVSVGEREAVETTAVSAKERIQVIMTGPVYNGVHRGISQINADTRRTSRYRLSP